ncbi:MAG: PorP/SprF family type IX secretion system membrane protein [Chitinophagaceae bacterium]
MKTLLKAGRQLLLMCGLCTTAAAQDIHFSQFYETSTLRNPALTGIYNGDYRFGVMYRSQWSSISAPFQTATAQAEIKRQIGEGQDFIGIGVLGFYDKTGSINLNTVSGNAAISYNKQLNEEHSTFLSAGLMVGYLQRSYDPGKITLGSQYIPGSGYDPANPSGEAFPNPKLNQLDFGLGLNYTSNTGADNKTNFSIGASAYHLTKPENNFYGNLAGVRQEMRFNVNASGNWLMDDTWSIQGLGNIMLQGKYYQVMVGGMVGRSNEGSGSENKLVLYGGLMYRLQDAIVPVFKIDYNDLTLGFSYDMNVSKLSTASNLKGGFEISLFKTGLMTDPQRGFSSTVCPRR